MAHMYGLDEVGLKIVADAKAVAEEVLAKHAAEVDQKGEFPAHCIAALGQRGFMGLCLPTAVGGKAQPPRVFAAVVEELAQGCASAAMIYVMHTSATMQIASSTTLANKDSILKDIAAGKHLTSLALSEKGSRSQFWMPVSKMEKSGDGYVTNALKSWVTSSKSANTHVATVQRPGSAGPLDSTLYLLKNNDKAVRHPTPFDGLGLRGNESGPITIENYKIAEGDLITPHGKGLEGMLQVILPWFATGTSAMANGLCRFAVAATQKHLSSTSFETGGSLRDLMTLRARLAEMSARTEQARALLAYTVKEMEAPNEMTPLYVLQSRWSSIDAALHVTDLAMKACGGAAFSKHLTLERTFRDARAGWVMAPTADHLLEFVGRALTGLPLL